ncbi:MAG: TonB-dependent receptor [Bacteroidota bacterium]
MKHYIKHITLLLLLTNQLTVKSSTLTLNGYVVDSKTGEAVNGAKVIAKPLKKGTYTNAYGYFAIQATDDIKTITISYIGYVSQEININTSNTTNLKINLVEKKNELKQVNVQAKKENDKVQSTEIGIIHIPIKSIANIPVIGGERDIIKVLQLMPGIKRGHDGSTGMFVRGGNSDQNLILMDEAPVYNASHLLGFFSIFNSDALKDVSMQKGGFTANYGGRLSSIMDVRLKEGNNQTFHAEGGIGILSSRLSIEGPIIKNKSSFIISARRTYIDQVYKLINKDLPYYFYDINAKINYKLSDKDILYFSSYIGDDVLSLHNPTDSSKQNTNKNIDFGSTLGNRTATLRWNHVYANKKLFSNISLIHSSFSYNITGNLAGNKLFITSSIQDYLIKMDYNYFKNNTNHIKFGFELAQHYFRPNVSKTEGLFNENIKPNDGLKISTQDMALYYLNDKEINKKWAINYGIRLTSAINQQTVYINPEPRINVRYALNDHASIKTSYTRMVQYLHLVSGSGAAMPTDLWYPVSKNIKPQTADQISVSYNQYIHKLKANLTIETYYKWMNNLVEYKEGTVAMLNNNIEEDLLQGTGKAYGLEITLQKQIGKLNGWIGYTVSYSTRQFDELNNGKTFFARYDRRHDFSIVANYQLSKRVAFSGVFVFASGSWFTPVTGQFLMPNGTYSNFDPLPIYSDRNAVQLSASHRLDLNLVIYSKPNKKWNSEWHIGAYNVYNRTQPYRIRVEQNANGQLQYQEQGLFGFIPSIAYNFKF